MDDGLAVRKFLGNLKSQKILKIFPHNKNHVLYVP